MPHSWKEYKTAPGDGGKLKNYNPPERFNHAKEYLVAHYPKDPPDGDGQSCDIYELRMPARFYRLVVHPDPDSIGRPGLPVQISTGSGPEMRNLLASLAEGISEGMICVYLAEEAQ